MLWWSIRINTIVIGTVLRMIKEVIKSSLFLMVLLTDSASFSAVKLKNKKQKSLDTYSHLVLYLYNE